MGSCIPYYRSDKVGLFLSITCKKAYCGQYFINKVSQIIMKVCVPYIRIKVLCLRLGNYSQLSISITIFVYRINVDIVYE
jgi:hypothetical protein